MLKNNHIPSYMMRSDQQGENGNTGGASVTSACAGLWIPDTVTLRDMGKNEEWLQKQIVANPTILGLGTVTVAKEQRRQPGGGKLDLLLRNTNTNKHYEIEIQLGATDPSHIIRTIEYWDLERRRYPQYSHCGVIVAEEITSRFFNVISLLNNSGQMPLIALKLTVLPLPCEQKGVGLLFTKILDEAMPPDLAEVDSQGESVDKNYWIQKVGPEQLECAIHAFRQIVSEGWDPNYTRAYIGLRQSDRNNALFAIQPQTRSIWIRFRMRESEQWSEKLQSIPCFVDNPRDNLWQAYRFQVTSKDKLQDHLGILQDLFRAAVNERGDE